MNHPVSENIKQIKKIKYYMILCFTAIIVAVSFFLSVLIIQKTDLILKNKTRTYLSDLTSQMKLNLNHYLDSLETTGNLVFASEDLYTYDAVTSQLNEYDTVTLESALSSNLYTLCMMENYNDFAIVYSNNHTIGKISNNTLSLSDSDLYQDMSSALSDDITNNGWLCGYQNDYTRIYYIKRVNEHAIFLCSFYTDELSRVFELSEDTMNFTTILADQNGHILYSPDRDEIGQSISSDLIEKISTRDSATIMDPSDLISVNSCDNKWYVLCSIPVREIIKEKNKVTTYISVVCIAGCIAAAFVSILLSYRLTLPVTKLVSALETKSQTDLLTGILNKHSFETAVQTKLFENPSFSMALILLDIDNFKHANDHYGHAMGDQILKRIGELTTKLFPSSALAGRIGGDEFAILLSKEDCPDQNIPFSVFLEKCCQNMCDSFKKELETLSVEKVSLSAGISFFPNDGMTFEKLYQKADIALYQSKEQGKDSYTIYEK